MISKKNIKDFENFAQRNYKKLMTERHNSEFPLDTSGSSCDDEINKFDKEIKNEAKLTEERKTKNRDDIQCSDITGKYTNNVNKPIAQGVLVNSLSQTFDPINGPSKELNDIDIVELSTYKLDILGDNFPILKNNIDTASIITQKEIDSFNKEIDEFNKEVNNIVFVDPDNKALVEKIIESFKIVWEKIQKQQTEKCNYSLKLKNTLFRAFFFNSFIVKIEP